MVHLFSPFCVAATVFIFPAEVLAARSGSLRSPSAWEGKRLPSFSGSTLTISTTSYMDLHPNDSTIALRRTEGPVEGSIGYPRV